jgi:hypothetical protein
MSVGTRWIGVAAIGVVALALVVPSARAQNVDAETLFRQGVQLEAAGKIAEACASFQDSNKIEPRAGTLIRLGECRLANHELASAWSAFTDSLTRVKDPIKRKIAEDAVANIEPRLSYLTISVPDESRVSGLVITRDGHNVDPMLWNRAIPVDGGKIVIAGQAPGHEEWQTTVDVPVEHGNAHVEVPKFKELAKLAPPPPSNPVPAPQLVVTAPPSPPSNALAYGLAGGGAAVGIAAIVLEMSSRSNISDARNVCPNDLHCSEPAYSQAKSLLDSAALRRDLAIAGGVIGVAAIGIGVDLYLAHRSSSRDVTTWHVTPTASPHGVAFSLEAAY